jgi:hypothetical protein
MLPFILCHYANHSTDEVRSMSERQKQHQGRSTEDESTIRGRDFAEADIAAEPQEQRESRRGRGNLDEIGEPSTASIPDPTTSPE